MPGEQRSHRTKGTARTAAWRDSRRVQTLTSAFKRITNNEGALSLVLLLAALAFNLYYLRSEVTIQAPKINDGILHLIVLRQTGEALSHGWDPTDFWLKPVAMGYALFHYYQHLGYLIPALFNRMLAGSISPEHLLDWTTYVLLVLFPLSIYWSLRRVGFGRVTSACAGLVAPLLATNSLYGLDYNSYVWRGWGLYTQLWGMVLLPPAVAQGYVALRDGRGYVLAGALLAATLLAHVIYGYLAVGSVLLFVLLSPSPREILARGRRVLLLLGVALLLTSYFLIPLLRDSAYLNRGVWELPEKYDSYGAGWVLGKLVTGDLFDYGRWPSLTVLGAAGLAFCLWNWRREMYRLPVALFLLWLLVYFGRPTWGFLFDLQPLGNDLYLHRIIGGVHLAGIVLIGIGLALPWRWALSRGGGRYLLLAAAFTALVLFPVYKERADYLNQNQTLLEFNRDSYQSEQRDLSQLTDTIKASGPGRVYAGLAGTWGKDYKVGSVPVFSLLNVSGLDMLGYTYFSFSFNADVQVIFDETRKADYEVFNVRYVVAPKDHPFPDFVKPVKDFGRHRLYQVDTGGYFSLVGSDVAFSGGKDDFYPAASTWLRSALPQNGQYPALFLTGHAPAGSSEYPLATAPDVIPRLQSAPGPARGRIVSQTVGDNDYTSVVQVERDSYLLLKVTYHPGWRAYVDGDRADTVMLMPSYEGVRLGPGSHLVRFEYKPPPLRHFLLVLALLGLPLMGLIEWRREQIAAYVRRRQDAGRLPRIGWPGRRPAG